jgi:hypothetical protein
MVGTTTVAAAVVEAEFDGWKFYSPRDPNDLRELAASRPRDSVVFLNDIEKLIDATGAIRDGIRALRARNVVLAGCAHGLSS